MSYSQIQAYPTPEIFVKQGIPPQAIGDQATGGLSLASASLFTPFVETVSDAGTVAFSLTSATEIVALVESVSDAGIGAFTLVTASQIVPLTETVSDAGTGTFSLTAVANVGPDTRSVTDLTGPTGALTLVTATAPAFNSAVSAWVARVVANGGATPSISTQAALSNFWTSIQTAALDTSILVLNAFVPDSLTAALTPFIKGASADPWGNSGFVSGDLTINGLAGNGSSKFSDTGLNAGSLGANLGMAVYAFTATATGFDYGSYDTMDFYIAAKYSDGNSYLTSGNPRAVGGVVVASPGAGFYTSQRTSSTVSKGYFANSSNAFAQIGSTDTTVSVGYPATRTQYSGAVQQSVGGAALYSSDRISFSCITTGLSSAQGATLYSLVQALRTALGGGFV